MNTQTAKSTEQMIYDKHAIFERHLGLNYNVCALYYTIGSECDKFKEHFEKENVPKYVGTMIYIMLGQPPHTDQFNIRKQSITAQAIALIYMNDPRIQAFMQEVAQQ